MFLYSDPTTRFESMDARLGDILVNQGHLSRNQVEEAVKNGEKSRIGNVLIERGLISEDQLLRALAQKFGCRYVNLSEVTPTPQALAALNRNAVTQMQILPIELKGKKLVVATSEPTDVSIADKSDSSLNTK